MIEKRLSVGIIDLNINNLFSIYKSCIEAGYKTEIISLKKNSFNYDIVILPGVGAFKSGMDFLKKNHIDKKIYNYLEKSSSLVYGICLGMQLLFKSSNEFTKTNGLNLINGNVGKFTSSKQIRVPHVGWNKIKIIDKNYKKIIKKFDNDSFYFIHSYYGSPKKKNNIFGITRYGDLDFCSMTKQKNVFGTQFHPEKSGKLGIEFLKNIKKLKSYK
jgi:glutamine amidotransferase